MPLTSTSTGAPAASARDIAGIFSGSTEITPRPAFVPSTDAGDEPTAADRDEHRVELGRLTLELAPDRALPGDASRAG